MDNTFDNLKLESKQFLDKLGGILIEEKYDPEYFGNSYIDLKIENFVLRLLNDRSQISIQIASIHDDSHFFDIAYVYSLVKKANKLLEFSDNWTEYLSYKQFILNNASILSQLFNELEVRVTIEKLNLLMRTIFNDTIGGS